MKQEARHLYMTGFEYHDDYRDHTVCEFTPAELKDWLDGADGLGYAYYYEVVGPVQQYVAPKNVDRWLPFEGLCDLAWGFAS